MKIRLGGGERQTGGTREIREEKRGLMIIDKGENEEEETER